MGNSRERINIEQIINRGDGVTILYLSQDLTLKQKIYNLKVLFTNFKDKTYKKPLRTTFFVTPKFVETYELKEGDDLNKKQEVNYYIRIIESAREDDLIDEGIPYFKTFKGTYRTHVLTIKE